jgi:hypothetical protein
MGGSIVRIITMKVFKGLFHIFFALLFVQLFSGLGTAYAQQGAGITLVPATIEEVSDPGSVLNRSLKVTNESSEEKEYYVYKRNIKGVEGAGVPIFSEDSEPTKFELSEWISFESERILIPANGTVEIPILITVPVDATPGSHFGGIFVSVEPPRLREIGAGVGYEVASIVSIRISGDVTDAARIRSFSTDKLFFSKKDVHFVAKIENQGNILIKPRGSVEILSMFSDRPEVVSVNDTLAGVFPGSTRDIEFDWKSDGVGFGRYEAILALSYDGEGGQKTIDSTLVFWIFPVKIMLSVIGAFVAVFAVGYLLTQYYVRQAIMRAADGRRITSSRYRKQVGVSRFTFMFISVLFVLVIFLIILLMFFA